jgi:hypothetical protein
VFWVFGEKSYWHGKEEEVLVKRISAHGGCLGTDRRRRTWQAAKSFGELQASIDPEISEWGNLAGSDFRRLL